MRFAELLKKAINHDQFRDATEGGNDLDALVNDLVTELDVDLISEGYEEDDNPKLVDLCDRLEAELKDLDEADDEEDEDESEDEDDDDDDEFSGLEDDDDED